jgi:hypothetical protein
MAYCFHNKSTLNLNTVYITAEKCFKFHEVFNDTVGNCIASNGKENNKLLIAKDLGVAVA